MKVLYIAENIPIPKRPGNRIVLTIAEKLSSKCDISFVYPAAVVFPPFSFMKKYRVLTDLKPWKDGKFTIVPVRYPRLPGKRWSYRLIDTVDPKQSVDENALPDLCHAHFIMPDGYLAYKIKQKYDIPYVVSVRSGDMRHIRALDRRSVILEKFMTVLKNADKIVVHNRPQQDFMSRLGFDSILIPHGIESDFLTPNVEKNETSITISVVAELIKRKNIDWVIRAVKEYTGAKDVQLTIAGDGVCGDELRRLAEGVSAIRFVGKIDRGAVRELLKTSCIFALPAVNETFGLVYSEAAATKNAVICHEDEGVDGLFENGKEMVFCDSYDDFKSKLFELIDDPYKCEKTANAGFNRVKDYTWEHVSDRYINMYETVCRKN